MKKVLIVILLVFALFFAFSLGKRLVQPKIYKEPRFLREKTQSSLPQPLAPTSEGKLESPEEISEQPGGSISERLVIKTGRLSLLVADVRRSAEQITKFVESEGGFVLSADIHRIKPGSQQLRGTLSVKVPAKKFTRIFNRIKNFGLKVVGENISGRDVTEEYIDLQSRLRNLEAAESQLLDLMKRAGSVSEILQVQKELVNTREKIERLKGRMEFLKKSAKMATITINLAVEEEELPVVEEGWRPKKVAKGALRSLIKFWQRIGNLAIWSAIFFSPFIFLGGLVFVWRKTKGRGK